MELHDKTLYLTVCYQPEVVRAFYGLDKEDDVTTYMPILHLEDSGDGQTLWSIVSPVPVTHKLLKKSCERIVKALKEGE